MCIEIMKWTTRIRTLISTVGVQLSFSYVSSEHLAVAAWEVLGSDSRKEEEEENHRPLSYVSYRSIRHRLRFPSLQRSLRHFTRKARQRGDGKQKENKNKEKDASKIKNKEQEQEIKSNPLSFEET